MKKSLINRFRVSSFLLRRYCIIVVLICLLIALLMSPSDKELKTESTAIAEEDKENTGHTPVIIFKLPRTGSSWFTQELNSFASVYISKEIIQAKDRGKYTTAEIENHLIKALTKPTGKISSKNRWLPDGRFVEDYLFHKSFKVFRSMDVIGFSVNPEHCKDVNWTLIATAVPNLKIIRFIRSNTIKTAVSSYRGKLTHQLCGVSNIKKTERKKKENLIISLRRNDCVIPDKVPWNVTVFVKEVNYWQNRFDEFRFSTDDGIFQMAKHPVSTTVAYELLQKNLGDTLQNLFHFLNKHDVFKNHRSVVSTDGWEKRTVDDLSSILTNFKDIKKYLEKTDSLPVLLPLTVSSGSSGSSGTSVSGSSSGSSNSGSKIINRYLSPHHNMTSFPLQYDTCDCWSNQLLSTTALLLPHCTRHLPQGAKQRYGCFQ